MFKYFQKSLNSCCLRSLDSTFASIEQTKSTIAIYFRIEEPFKNKVGNRINFVNAILRKEK